MNRSIAPQPVSDAPFLSGVIGPELTRAMWYELADAENDQAMSIGAFACTDGVEFVESSLNPDGATRHYYVIQDRDSYERDTIGGMKLMEISVRAIEGAEPSEVEWGMRLGSEIDDLRSTEVRRIVKAIVDGATSVKADSAMRQDAMTARKKALASHRLLSNLPLRVRE